jgi:hypothetical protein
MIISSPHWAYEIFANSLKNNLSNIIIPILAEFFSYWFHKLETKCDLDELLTVLPHLSKYKTISYSSGLHNSSYPYSPFYKYRDDIGICNVKLK